MISKPDVIAPAHPGPVKAVGKYDDFVPEQLLDEANTRNRWDIQAQLKRVKPFSMPRVFTLKQKRRGFN
ncbi:MAG: hypothetical protein ABSD57_02240 [Verrucomicrobiota bacterium]|jgi:hypothetical protein